MLRSSPPPQILRTLAPLYPRATPNPLHTLASSQAIVYLPPPHSLGPFLSQWDPNIWILLYVPINIKQPTINHFSSPHLLIGFDWIHNDASQQLGGIPSHGIPPGVTSWGVCINLSVWIPGHDTPAVAVRCVWGLSQHCVSGVTPGLTLVYFSCDRFHIPLLSPSPLHPGSGCVSVRRGVGGQVSARLVKLLFFSGIATLFGTNSCFSFCTFYPSCQAAHVQEGRLDVNEGVRLIKDGRWWNT